MSFSQIATSVSILSSGLKSYQAISLTNFVTSAASLIASGSAIEIANAFFLADSNITPNATSWTLVGTGNTAYIILTPSGSAGSQVLSAAYTATAPVWSLSKGAWYGSAASLTRYVAGVTKTSPTQYDDAFILPGVQERTVDKLTVRDEFIGGKITLSGAITPQLNISESSEGIGAGGNWVVPAGIYVIGATGSTTEPIVQILINGNWTNSEVLAGHTAGTPHATTMVSDGTNTRVYNPAGGLRTVYYRKL